MIRDRWHSGCGAGMSWRCLRLLPEDNSAMLTPQTRKLPGKRNEKKRCIFASDVKHWACLKADVPTKLQ